MIKKVFLTLISLGIYISNYAHEPLYGLGPETLPKHLSAIELGYRYKFGEVEYGFGYGYGINQNWTVRLDIPTINDNSSVGLGNIVIRTKYALLRNFAPGVLKRLTAISAVKIPTAMNSINSNTAITLGIANGYESRRWYYFSDVGYTYFPTVNNLTRGGKLKYNLVGGIRPKKTAYLKPDLVLLVEVNGELSGKSKTNGTVLSQTGGNTLAFAPGFLLSYRNIMLKAGMQFGIAEYGNSTKPITNGLVSLEYHF